MKSWLHESSRNGPRKIPLRPAVKGAQSRKALYFLFFCGLREAAQVPVLRAGATETQVGGPRAFRGQRCPGCLDFVLSAGYGSGGQSVQPNQGTLHVRDYSSTSQVPHLNALVHSPPQSQGCNCLSESKTSRVKEIYFSENVPNGYP